MNCGIYQIENTIDGKRYIGSTIDLERRFIEHVDSLQKENHANRYLQRAWLKYGENSFKFSILLYCSKENLLFYEQRALDVINSLYNICPIAGSKLGTIYSEESKRRISEAKKGYPAWNKGIPRTEEEKRKMSESHKGQPLSEEHKFRISEVTRGEKNPFYGKRHSEETCKKISEKKIGSPAWNKGKPFSEEARENMSRAHLGQIAWNKGRTGVYTEEMRKRMSESHKGRRK